MDHFEREALDRYLTRGDRDDEEPDDVDVADCLAGNDDPEARPCGRCAACERHALELADTGESPAAGGW